MIEKPVGIDDPNSEKLTKEFIQTVKLMSAVKVVTRKPQFQRKEAVPAAPSMMKKLPTPTNIKLIAIGGSTDATLVLQKILLPLPNNFPVPVVIVQHRATGFIDGLVEWFEQTTGFPVHLGTHGENLLPGHAYIAPDDFHMEISSKKTKYLSARLKKKPAF